MTSAPTLASLDDFLKSAFTSDELRNFLFSLPEGKHLGASLPGESASHTVLVFEAVHLLERHGMIDREFFELLTEVRPARRSEIAHLAAAFGLDVRAPVFAAHPPPGERASIVLLHARDGLAAVEQLRLRLERWVSRGVLDVHVIPITELPADFAEGTVCAVLVSAKLVDDPRAHDAMRLLMTHHRRGALRLQPILMTRTPWRTTVLGRIPPLPGNGVPIAEWKDAEVAWSEVVQALVRALPSQPNVDGGESSEVLSARSLPQRSATLHLTTPRPPALATPESAPAPTLAPAPRLRINNIFRTSGAPDVNFVAPAQLPELIVRMGFMGDGLVVEGPSGIGKTTAARHALLASLGTDDFAALINERKVVWLTSKSDDDVAALKSLLDAGHAALRGHLVVDDFHRLDRALQRRVADFMKLIADGGTDLAKIVVIGINPVGTSLVQDFPDLAGRFTVVSMSKQPDDKIEELIIKGEQAANIKFDKRPQFVQAARGSFFTAQLLCLEAAIRANILETSPILQTVPIGPDGVVLDKVHSRLKFKYHDQVIAFASHDERPPPRGACLSLLWLMSQSPDSTVSLVTAKTRYPQLAAAFDWLLGSNLAALFAAQPRLRELFYYNRDAAILSAEDPQLDFYLQHINWPALARDSGNMSLDWDPQRGFRPREPAAAAEPVVAPAIVSMRVPPSRVLHLSDLHFGSQKQALLWYDQLFSDLRTELACDGLDAVVLSGDISNRAASDEFDAASQFLRDLKDDFKLNPNQFILVPGNHDLNWTISKQAYKVHRRAEYTSPLVPGQFIDNGEYIEVPVDAELRNRFQPFADFYYQVRYEPYPLDYEYQATVHHFPDRKLLFLGLNSAWSLDHAFRDRADIHAVALGRALRRIQQEPSYVDCVKIAVWHHPVSSPDPDRLRDTGFVERLAQAGFRLALHGHIHKPQQGLFRYDMSAGGRKIDFLGAGTFGAPTHEWVPGFPLQYQLLEFNDGKVRVRTRRREELNGAWKPDARWTQGAGQNPLPYYELDL